MSKQKTQSLVLVLDALAAGGAAADGLARELDQLRFDAFFLKLGKDLPDQDRGVAVLAGTAVECDYLHGTFPFASSWVSFDQRAMVVEDGRCRNL